MKKPTSTGTQPMSERPVNSPLLAQSQPGLLNDYMKPNGKGDHALRRLNTSPGG
jgi:hypothetical protein